MKTIIEGTEFLNVIRRGFPMPIPDNADIVVITGRGASEDRIEVTYPLEELPNVPTVPMDDCIIEDLESVEDSDAPAIPDPDDDDSDPFV